jgi:serine protease Do
MEQSNIERYDRYLLNRMSPHERKAFEEELSSNQALSDDYEAYRTAAMVVKRSFARKKMKKELQRLHYNSFKGKDLVSHLRAERRKRYLRFTAQLAVAASVATLITLSILHFTIGLGIGQSDVYVELRNEVQNIQDAQEYLKQELIRSKQTPVLFTGSSFAVSSDGLLATNYHVIRGLDSVWVSNYYMDSLVRYKAAIVYANRIKDIALLKIVDPSFKGFGELPYAISSTHAHMGEYVFTLGYSKQDIVFGEGSISSVSGYRSDTSSYQVSVPINPGNSGGPLFDQQGNLLGMISGKNIMKDGAGFAIKIDYLLEAIAELDGLDEAYSPAVNSRNKISNRKRSDQLKQIQPLVFRVQIAK